MNQTTLLKTRPSMIKTVPQTLKIILEEIRLLRDEMMFLFPQEDIKEYAHPDRIQRSFSKAKKKYPPVSLWK